ncbi:MAG: hypothetical protein ACYC5O_17335, partial [Anaerolineae bacterium]
SAYNGKSFAADPYVRQQFNSHTFKTVSGVQLTVPLEPKALQDEMGEAYDTTYGRMSGMMGLELPSSVSGVQNFMLYPYSSPPVELITDCKVVSEPVAGDGTQIWKITHNGVDTHTYHWHLFNVQLINRVAWDGAILVPDANELGWKETVRVNPLEHTIVALRPVLPTLPWKLPNSVHALDVTMPLGEPLMGAPGGFVDPGGEPVTVINHEVNFGHEYVYHCHLLAHEEMDMMHAVVLAVAPDASSSLTGTPLGGTSGLRLTWVDNAMNETGFVVRKATAAAGPWTTLTTMAAAAGVGSTVTYTDTTYRNANTAYYQVYATNVVGDTTVYAAPAVGFPTKTLDSAALTIGPITGGPAGGPVGVTTLTSVVQGQPRFVPRVVLTWTYVPSGDQTGFVIQRASDAAFTTGLTSFTVGRTVRTYSDWSVRRGRTYYYRVAARNALGTGTWSAVSSPIVPLSVDPGDDAPVNEVFAPLVKGGSGQ